VKVIRDRTPATLAVEVGEQPGEEAVVAALQKEQGLGLTIEPLTAEAAQKFNLTVRSGIVVTEVAPGSSGAAAGIRPGDAILEVNRTPVPDVRTFKEIVASVKPGDSVPVYLQRGGGGRNEYVVLKAPDRKP
jgi:serine protease Do